MANRRDTMDGLFALLLLDLLGPPPEPPFMDHEYDPSIPEGHYQPISVGWHVHQCDNCGLEWQHDSTGVTDPVQYADSHFCPNCGEEQRMVQQILRLIGELPSNNIRTH